MSDLLPCPFCGSTSVAERYDDGYVSCAGCHAYGPEGGEKTWNKRVEASNDLVGEMGKALEPFAAAADFKESGYTFEIPDTAYCDVTLADCRKARATLSRMRDARNGGGDVER